MKENALSLVRALLAFGGTFLAGHALMGHPITSQIVDTATGSILTISGIVWGIVDKSIPSDQWSSAIRNGIAAGGGVLLALGVVTQQTLDSITAIAMAIIPVLQAHTARQTAQAISTGQATVASTGKVVKSIPAAK